MPRDLAFGLFNMKLFVIFSSFQRMRKQKRPCERAATA
jgi:hypothetical protein